MTSDERPSRDADAPAGTPAPTDGPAEETSAAGPDWRDSLETARTEARSEGTLLFVDLYDPG